VEPPQHEIDPLPNDGFHLVLSLFPWLDAVAPSAAPCWIIGRRVRVGREAGAFGRTFK
jgi:hypothetical protein